MTDDVFNTDPTPAVSSGAEYHKNPHFAGKPHRLKKGEARTREIGKLGGEASANRTILDAAVVKELSPDELAKLIRIFYDKALKGNLPFGEFIMKHLNLITTKSQVDLNMATSDEQKVKAFKDALLIKDSGDIVVE